MSETIRLTAKWSLQKLSVAGHPQWALCCNGMQWLKVSDFLEAGIPTIDEDVREFARDVAREKHHCEDCARTKKRAPRGRGQVKGGNAQGGHTGPKGG